MKEISESYSKKGILFLPLRRINISPVKSKKNNLKSNKKTEVIKNIDNINLKKNKNNHRNSILQRLLKKNNKYNCYNEIDHHLNLFGIDNNNNFIKFDVKMKQYSFIKLDEIKVLSNTFYKDYIYNSSILLNNFNGLYILTGINTNILYFFNNKIKSIIKICTFIYPHNNGSLLLDNKKNRIFAFSGKNTNKCEYYSFSSKKVKEIPELNNNRINSSYIISNNKIICLFGYSINKNENINNIEIFDLEKMNKWEIKNLNINFNIERCSSINFKKEENIIYLFLEGHKCGKYQIKIMYLYDANKNEINIINNLIIEEYKKDKCIWVKNEDKYINDREIVIEKCLNFLELPKEMNNNYFDNNFDNIAVILDNNNNAYYFYKSQMKIEIYKNYMPL